MVQEDGERIAESVSSSSPKKEKANLISQTDRGSWRAGAPALQSKRKGPSRFLSTAFINAGNDLRSHTLGACSTIGPAGLNYRVRDGNGWIPRGKITDNLRRFAGVNEAAEQAAKWEPAAETLSVLCEGSHSAPSRFSESTQGLKPNSD